MEPTVGSDQDESGGASVSSHRNAASPTSRSDPPREPTSESKWLHIIRIVHPIVAIVGGLLAIVSGTVKQFEPGVPPQSRPPVTDIRLLVTEDTALYGWTNAVWTELHGTVSGIDTSNRKEYAAVVYTFAWDPGKEIGYWYVQPFATDCHARIGHENTWQARVRRGSDYGVLLAELRTPLRQSQGDETGNGPIPGADTISAGGCPYPAKLLTFPPSQPGIMVWVVTRAKSKWTVILYIGLCSLAVAFLLCFRWLGPRFHRFRPPSPPSQAV
jgi:hypothetical protein